MSCWTGNEELKNELIKYAKLINETEKPLKGVDDNVWFNNVVSGIKGKDYNPIFYNKVEAHKKYNELVSKAVKEYGINIHEVRYITVPYFNPHPTELARLEKEVKRVRRKEIKRVRRNEVKRVRK